MKALKCIFPDTGKIVNFRQFTTTSKLYPLTEGGTLMRMMRLAPNFRAGCARKGRIGLIQRFFDPPHTFSPAFAQSPNPATKENKTHTRCKTRSIWALFVWRIKVRAVFFRNNIHSLFFAFPGMFLDAYLVKETSRPDQILILLNTQTKLGI